MGPAFLCIFLLVAVGLAWFFIDIRYLQKSGLELAELYARYDRPAISAHFESRLNTWRPFALLFQRFVIPGLLEGEYALHLSNEGEHEKALLLAEKAMRKATKKMRYYLAILPAKVTVLLRLGRHQDARNVAQMGRDLLGVHSVELEAVGQLATLTGNILLPAALVEMSLGNLNQALAVGNEVKALDTPVAEPGRVLAASVLSYQGRFQEALEALAGRPSKAEEYFSDHDKELVGKDPLFQQTVEKMEEEHAAVFPLGVELEMASIYLDSGDVLNAGLALQRVQKLLKSQKIIEHIFVRTRACWNALEGDVAAARADIDSARKIAQEFPKNRSAKFETHLAAGRAFLLIGDTAPALLEVNQALAMTLHPMEKHRALYWAARINESGNKLLAIQQFKEVAAHHFGTWMEADSQNRSGIKQ